MQADTVVYIPKEWVVPAVGPDDIVGAFAAMARERAEAVIVMPSPMLFK